MTTREKSSSSSSPSVSAGGVRELLESTVFRCVTCGQHWSLGRVLAHDCCDCAAGFTVAVALEAHAAPPEVPHEKEHEEHLARVDESGSSADRATAAEIEALRATNKRLNRRCQLAEAAANLKVEEWDKRSKGAGRAYVFELGKWAGWRDGLAHAREELAKFDWRGQREEVLAIIDAVHEREP